MNVLEQMQARVRDLDARAIRLEVEVTADRQQRLADTAAAYDARAAELLRSWGVTPATPQQRHHAPGDLAALIEAEADSLADEEHRGVALADAELERMPTNQSVAAMVLSLLGYTRDGERWVEAEQGRPKRSESQRQRPRPKPAQIAAADAGAGADSFSAWYRAHQPTQPASVRLADATTGEPEAGAVSAILDLMGITPTSADQPER